MKNKIKIILYTLSILLLSFTNAYSSEIKIDNPPEMRDSRFACKTYFEKLSKSDDNSVRNIYSSHSYDDYGFYIEQIYDFKKNKWVAKKDINNNLKIGQIYNNETASKINSGDPIISINGNKITNEEEFIKYNKANKNLGKILFANLELQSLGSLKLYRFESDKGKIEYFDENGKSAKKLLMKTPIDGARLSSGFGMRKHPIRGYMKKHKGVDFAAPKGTPIYAAGDGVIEMKQRYKGYGKYILIRHANNFKTAYGHMSKFNKTPGGRVKQGKIIGYVGSTGNSTGPHLHYEVLKNNIRINPQKLKLNRKRDRGLVYELTYSKYIKKVNVYTEGFINYSLNDNNLLRFYKGNLKKDSIYVVVEAFDSLQEKTIDSLFVFFGKKSKSVLKLSHKLNTNHRNDLDDTLLLNFSFSKPINKKLFSFSFYIDTVFYNGPYYSNSVWNKNKTKNKTKLYLNQNSINLFLDSLRNKAVADSLTYKKDSIYTFFINYYKRLKKDRVFFVVPKGNVISIEKDTLSKIEKVANQKNF